MLGLAHSRTGSQAGATATFEGTLPAYVDPVVPSFLRAGDTCACRYNWSTTLTRPCKPRSTSKCEGGVLKSKAQSVSLGKRSSTVRYVEITTEQAGELRLMARMGERTWSFAPSRCSPPANRLAKPRAAPWPPLGRFHQGAQAQGASKGVARLSVFPGALSLLRSELGASLHRGGVASDAFALLLAGKAPELLRSLAMSPMPSNCASSRLRPRKKSCNMPRALSIENAALIAEAARAHVGNPVLERLGQRAIATIESSQAPDGTCGGQSGWTLQRLLVATADCARAAHDSPNVSIKLPVRSSATPKRLPIPYTAAGYPAANAASGKLAETLRAQVLAAIEERDNGAKILAVPRGVVRADGQAPSIVEATAMAVLALADWPMPLWQIRARPF